MKKISSRKNLLKDAAILLALVALLVALPWTQNFLKRGETEVAIEQDRAPAPSQNSESLATRDLTALEEQKAFIEEVFPVISSWQAGALEPYLADATKSGDWSSDIGSALNILSERLGALETYGEPEPITISDVPTQTQGVELSAYEFEAYYVDGIADINIMLAGSGENSLLYSFNITVRE